MSHTARLYDPNGYLAPVTVVAKMAIQQLWKENCGWDEPVPKSIQKEWTIWHNQLGKLEDIRIPRWFGTTSKSVRQIHGFCDASKKAYAAVVYLVAENDGRPPTTSIIMAKTKVAPLKELTIPKLELNGAVLLSELAADAIKVLEMKMTDCHLWTDSTIALCWIKKQPRKRKEYVSNRVAKIQIQTKGAQWHHVPTEMNPADMASRGISPSELVNNKLWWNGPCWMKERQPKWPNEPPAISTKEIMEVEKEEKPPKVMVITMTVPLIENNQGEVLQQYSSLNKATNILGYVLRFKNNTRTNESERLKGPLTNEEKLEAETIWIKHRQAVHYAKEIEACVENKPLPKNTKLLGVRPFLDHEGVMRSGTRLEKANLTYDEKHPILLPPNDWYTMLWMKHSHKKTLHGGPQLMLQYLRNKYWIPNARRLAKTIISECIICYRQRKIPCEQLMGSLPRQRITPGKPFETTGVDYCGPMTIKERKGRCKIQTKGYVAVFVCLKTRAVHLELVSELTTAAFMVAYRRLTARRGRVTVLNSDNGTTFTGAAAEIQKIYASWRKTAISDELNAMRTTWEFITPVAPHQGGIWKAAVKSAKHHLKRIIGDHVLTFEEMTTLLCDIEACLNSRPLCATTDDAGDYTIITPGHLLIGEPVVAPLSKSVKNTPTNHVDRWKLLLRAQEYFWIDWQRDYLHSLSQRTKWKIQNDNIAIDDIVLMHLENQPPTHWPLARVTQVFPGPDGLIRNVVVLKIASFVTVFFQFLVTWIFWYINIFSFKKCYTLKSERRELTRITTDSEIKKR